MSFTSLFGTAASVVSTARSTLAVANAASGVVSAASSASGALRGFFASSIGAFTDPTGAKDGLERNCKTHPIDPLIAVQDVARLTQLYNILLVLSVAIRPTIAARYPDFQRQHLPCLLGRLFEIEAVEAQDLAAAFVNLTTHHLDPRHHDPHKSVAISVIQWGFAYEGKLTTHAFNLLKSCNEFFDSQPTCRTYHQGDLIALCTDGTVPVDVVLQRGADYLAGRLPLNCFIQRWQFVLSENPCEGVYASVGGRSAAAAPSQFVYRQAGVGRYAEVFISEIKGNPTLFLHSLLAAKVISPVISPEWYAEFVELVQPTFSAAPSAASAAATRTIEPMTAERYAQFRALISRLEVLPNAPKVTVLSSLIGNGDSNDLFIFIIVKHLIENGVNFSKTYSLEDAHAMDLFFSTSLYQLSAELDGETHTQRLLPPDETRSFVAFCKFVNAFRTDLYTDMQDLILCYFSRIKFLDVNLIRTETYSAYGLDLEIARNLCVQFEVPFDAENLGETYVRLNQKFMQQFVEGVRERLGSGSRYLESSLRSHLFAPTETPTALRNYLNPRARPRSRSATEARPHGSSSLVNYTNVHGSSVTLADVANPQVSLAHDIGRGYFQRGQVPVWAVCMSPTQYLAERRAPRSEEHAVSAAVAELFEELEVVS